MLGSPRLTITLTIALIAGISLLSYYRLAGDRSVFLTAQTQLLQIDNLELGTVRFWDFPKAALCEASSARSRLAETILPATGSQESGLCPTGMHTLHEGAIILSFAAGASISLERRGLGPVLMSIRDAKVGEDQASTIGFLGATDSQEIRNTHSFIIAIDTPTHSPFSLALRGMLTLGTHEGGSGQALVTSGKYEIRERLRLRSRPQMVTSGNIELGDVVRVVRARSERQGRAASVLGHSLISIEDPGSHGFRLAFTATAEPRVTELLSDLAIEISRMGFAPTQIEPTWTSRALADPLTYILGLFVTIIATSLAIVANALEIKGARFDTPEANTRATTTDGSNILASNSEKENEQAPETPINSDDKDTVELVPDKSIDEPPDLQRGSSSSTSEKL